jgi:pimeloyl-ACP methyl ester carboxylesterase
MQVGLMAPRSAGGFMDRMRTLKDPKVVAPWLRLADLDYYESEYTANGFAGGLNYYRCMDYTTESGKPYSGKPITQPALFIGGTTDMVVSTCAV